MSNPKPENIPGWKRWAANGEAAQGQAGRDADGSIRQEENRLFCRPGIEDTTYVTAPHLS